MYTRVHARTRADPRLPSCTCLFPSVASSSDSLMSALHQADVRLAPGCVTFPILVQQGYMAVQQGYMEVQQGYMAVQQGYMLNSNTGVALASSEADPSSWARLTDKISQQC